jgi:glycogen debranching enzyme
VHGQYLCLDRVTGSLIDSRSIGGLLAAFAPIPHERAARIARTIDGHAARFRVASHAPDDPRFQSKRYWRGPTWLVVNYMIGDGLARAGLEEAAEAITSSSLDLIRTSGFAEYYDPHSGEPLGGGHFTWTAAMVLEFLALAD